ncbi:GMC family oxidoreductase [Jatrophihabitans sp.]|jgi:choline dehydrogenase|uniref:GMC family oxidoreductase n=1 Tax=Jatrophihabitans sp. TaxID=1932789 RepID=UPI002F1EB6E2
MFYMGQQVYNDIIIGAGSAGCVLAARLSEDGRRRVALLEAGTHYQDAAAMPQDLLDGNSMSLVQHSWGLAAQLTADRRVAFPQGKVSGGGSAIGNTVAIRGMPADYDEWAELGNPLWSWTKALPTLAAVEDDLDYGHRRFHNATGPLPIRRWREEELTAVQQAFLDGCLANGYPYAEDHNHPGSYGVGPIPSTRRDARTRVSTAMAYLWPAQDRAGLEVFPDTCVDRIVIRDGRAVGVIVDGEEVSADRVILAAGAVWTPTILWRSGIGPADELRRLGIDVRVDRPGVGAGLIDQPRIGVFVTPKPGRDNYGASTGQIVLRTTSSGSDARANDMYYAMVNRFDLAHHFPELRKGADGSIVYGVMAVARRAHSRGSVTLQSADPSVAPRIDLGYLSDERDYPLMAEAVRQCWELATTPAVLEHGRHVVLMNEQILASEEAMRAYIASAIDTAYNPVGTARMGAADDEAAVVDQYCGVYGTEGLFVADASVMPTMVCANTLLSVLMIAERASLLLRER